MIMIFFLSRLIILRYISGRHALRPYFAMKMGKQHPNEWKKNRRKKMKSKNEVSNGKLWKNSMGNEPYS